MTKEFLHKPKPSVIITENWHLGGGGRYKYFEIFVGGGTKTGGVQIFRDTGAPFD